MSGAIPFFSKLCVLVVDDQEFVRKMVAQFLKNLGCPLVLDAADGIAALDICKSANPDLVICDVNMKPLNGFDFLRTIRNSDDVPDPAVPVIFLTAYDWGSVTKSGVQEVDAYLNKPVKPSELQTQIERVVPPGHGTFGSIVRDEREKQPLNVNTETVLLAALKTKGFTEIEQVKRTGGWWHAKAKAPGGARVKLQISPYTGEVVRERVA